MKESILMKILYSSKWAFSIAKVHNLNPDPALAIDPFLARKIQIKIKSMIKSKTF